MGEQSLGMFDLSAAKPAAVPNQPVAPSNPKRFKSQLLEFLQRVPSVDLQEVKFTVVKSEGSKEPLFRCTLRCPTLPTTIMGCIQAQVFEGHGRSKKNAEHVTAEMAIKFYQDKGLLPKQSTEVQPVQPVVAYDQHFQPQYQPAIQIHQGSQFAVPMHFTSSQPHQQVVNQPVHTVQAVQAVQTFQQQVQGSQAVQSVPPPQYTPSFAGWAAVSTGSPGPATEAGISQGCMPPEHNFGGTDDVEYYSKADIDSELKQLESHEKDDTRWAFVQQTTTSLSHGDALEHLKQAAERISELEDENRKLKKLLLASKSEAVGIVDIALRLLLKQKNEGAS